MEDKEVSTGIACEDQLEILRKRAASRHAVAGDGGKDFFGFDLPHLEGPVQRCRDRALPVRRHRHRSDII